MIPPLSPPPVSGTREDAAAEQVTARIVKTPQGKYRWLCAVNVFRDIYALQGMGWILLVMMALVAGILLLNTAKGDGDELRFAMMAFPVSAAVFAILLAVFYLLDGLSRGWSNKMLYEMDRHGILGKEVTREVWWPESLKYTRGLSLAAGFLLGHAELISMSLYSPQSKLTDRVDFGRLRGIRCSRKIGRIRLDCGFLRTNYVHAAPEDLDFVLGYIREVTGIGE